MATRNPRMMVTLKPETYDTYRRLAELQGRSMSKLANEQLEFMAPTLRKVINFQERINQTTEKNRRAFEKGASKAEEHMQLLFGLFEGIFDAVEEASASEVAGGAGTAPGGSRRAIKGKKSEQRRVVEVDGHGRKLPPPSNTGVTFSDSGSKAHQGGN